MWKQSAAPAVLSSMSARKCPIGSWPWNCLSTWMAMTWSPSALRWMPALKVFSGQGHWCSWTPWRSWVFKESACTKCYAKHFACLFHTCSIYVCRLWRLPFFWGLGWLQLLPQSEAWLCFCDGCSQQSTCRSSTGDVILYSAAVKCMEGASQWQTGLRLFREVQDSRQINGQCGRSAPIMSSSICSIVFWWWCWNSPALNERIFA